MTLQKIVNQTYYAARTATLGVALSFSLAGAPKAAYGNNGKTVYVPAPLNYDNSTTIINTSNEEERNSQIAGEIFDEPQSSTDSGNLHPANLVKSPLKGLSPIEKHYLSLSPAQRQKYTAEQERLERLKAREQAADELAEQLERTEQSDFPSLSSLKEHYHDLEQKNGSTHYKAQYLSGYYVHYSQTHKIYYVERKDNESGAGRITVAYYIANENGTVLFRANEKGEMVRVENKIETALSAQNTLEARVEQERKQSLVESQTKQPTVADIDVFPNMFDCSSQRGLYSATGEGVGTLAVIASLATLLHIRRRRKLL